jgi:hypothetical protein
MYARLIPLLIAAGAALSSACDDYSDPERPGQQDLRRAPGDGQPIERPAYGDRDLDRVGDRDRKLDDDDDRDGRDGIDVLPDGNRADDRRATPDADNTAVNERDENGATLTPIDQSNSQADINVTADIRKRILDEEGLSTNADNVKIITSGGVVTLRGVVDSQDEKTRVEAIAKSAAGVTRVDNQLELNLQ